MDYNKITQTSKYKEYLDKLLGEGKWELKRNSHKVVDWSSKLEIGKFKLMVDKEEIASFELHPMINCCGIAVSTAARVSEKYRGKGLGRLLNSLRIDIARNADYSLLMCTDIESNIYQRKVLKANGWTDQTSFVNKRTRNRVYISTIHL